MKVFLVIRESYPEDHEVLGVFSSAEAANRYIDNEVLLSQGSARPEVHEWDVSDELW